MVIVNGLYVIVFQLFLNTHQTWFRRSADLCVQNTLKLTYDHLQVGKRGGRMQGWGTKHLLAHGATLAGYRLRLIESTYGRV